MGGCSSRLFAGSEKLPAGQRPNAKRHQAQERSTADPVHRVLLLPPANLARILDRNRLAAMAAGTGVSRWPLCSSFAPSQRREREGPGGPHLLVEEDSVHTQAQQRKAIGDGLLHSLRGRLGHQ